MAKGKVNAVQLTRLPLMSLSRLNLDIYADEQRKRILLVDDEASILKSAERCLKNRHFIIDSFTCPQKALESARHTAYQLVITDQRMPIMSGVELLVHIARLQPECVGIILSGLCDSETLLDAINHTRIYRYLCKPWQDEELRNVVDAAIEHHNALYDTQRLADKARVNDGSMTKHRAYLRELEAKYPGITQVERDQNGAIVLHNQKILR